jgi:hypothetical protein
MTVLTFFIQKGSEDIQVVSIEWRPTNPFSQQQPPNPACEVLIFL